MPWRGSKDPYTIWLSEIILQQTRVNQGMPYFLRFRERFPTVRHLADASEEEVLKLWQGLGYYSRARNLHKTARKVANEMDGRFPDTYGELLSLSGVGPYTAAAIASICYGLPHPVVDGNVYRVLARYFNVTLPVNTTEGRRYFDRLAHEAMAPGQIADYNQGIMEFGAVQCVPANPDCAVCPLANSCGALAGKQVRELPVKLPKNPIKERHFHYIMPVDTDLRTYMQQRTLPGIWRGLYEFPLLERESAPGPEEIAGCLREATRLPGLRVERSVRLNETPVVHKLSHQHLRTTFWIAHVKGLPEESLSLEDAGRYPVPKLIERFMETVKNSYF